MIKPSPLLARPFVRRMLATALLAEIGYAVLNISTMPVYLKNDRAFSTFSISLVIMAFLLSEAVMKGPMGHLADRLGHRRLMLIGPLLTLGTSILSLILPRFDHFQGESIEVLMFCVLRVGDAFERQGFGNETDLAEFFRRELEDARAAFVGDL